MKATASQNTETANLRRRAARGDRSAMTRLIELQIEPLRRWAHRKLPSWARSVSDTADVVQDAIARTLDRIGAIKIDERGALGAYLRQAVNNRIADEFRRVQRRGIPVSIETEVLSTASSPFDDAAAEELSRRYKRAVATLNASNQQLVVGHVELEHTVEQLACLTGRTIPATRIALRRALVRLAAAMSRPRE